MSQIAGILPAIVFPAATAAQLVQIVRTRSVAGVSATTWVSFGVANIAMYIYTERFTEWQAIIGMLVTALLDFAIAAGAICKRSAPSVAGKGDRQGLRIVSQESASSLRTSHP